MNTRLWHAVALTIVIAMAQSNAGVSYKSPPIDRLGQVGLIYTHSAKTLGMGRLALGLYGNATNDPGYLRDVLTSRPDTTGGIVSTTWDTSVTGYEPGLQTYTLHPTLAFGLTRFLDFSGTMPVYFDRLNEDAATGFGGVTGGFGDVELAMKFQYPPYPQRRLWAAAYYGAVSIPTGDANAGYIPRHTYYLPREDTTDIESFYTSNSAEIDMKMLWTFDFSQLQEASPVEVHVNYGVRWTFNPLLDHLFLLNIAFQYQPVPWMHLFTDFSGESRIRNIEKGFRIGEDPLRLTPGIAFTPEGGFYMSLGADINLSTDTTNHYPYSADRWMNLEIQPQWRATATIGWSGFILPQDADQDGIKDNVDKCPTVPEDIDGFEDNDGCPDNDNDNDGIPDLKDRCPNDPEDLDGFEDEDGCPDNDNDKDLIADTDDQCPMVPEDLDGFEDNDGCPDVDNDQDGIDDTLDHCITIPEDRDGFQDNDGCPDPDNDLDAVPDSVDSCPDVPGDASNKGCPKPQEKPRAKEIKRGRVILRGVNFESGKAVLTTDSYAILDRVYESLVEWPEVRIEIIGHTDSVGSALYNRLLSRRRAGAVREYLMTRGINSDRLVAKGKGESEPIADNTTAAGRALNRRVELHRID